MCKTYVSRVIIMQTCMHFDYNILHLCTLGTPPLSNALFTVSGSSIHKKKYMYSLVRSNKEFKSAVMYKTNTCRYTHNTWLKRVNILKRKGQHDISCIKTYLHYLLNDGWALFSTLDVLQAMHLTKMLRHRCQQPKPGEWKRCVDAVGKQPTMTF